MAFCDNNTIDVNKALDVKQCFDVNDSFDVIFGHPKLKAKVIPTLSYLRVLGY